MYRALGYFVLILHCAIVFLIVGASIPLAICFEGIRIFLIIFIASLIPAWLMLGNCPSTVLEKKIWSKCAPEKVYQGDFISHYSQKYLGRRVKSKHVNYIVLVFVVIHLVIFIVL